MTKNEIMGKTLSYQELIEALEQFKRAHPPVRPPCHPSRSVVFYLGDLATKPVELPGCI